MSQQVIEIPVDELQPNPLQPRGVITPESLTDLIESIRQHGILEPLVVAKTPAGYQIIAGERRWRSAKILGLKEVPAIVKETNPRQMLEWALIENVQREDLGPLDRAKAFERLEVEFGLSLAEIAEKIGKSEAYISNSIRLLSLPDAVKDGLLSGLISEGHARAIAGLKPPEKIVTAFANNGWPIFTSLFFAKRTLSKFTFSPSFLSPSPKTSISSPAATRYCWPPHEIIAYCGLSFC
jgi:ParB family chromosome partitioning protein